MLKILTVSAALSFLFVSGAIAQSGGGAGACVADIKKVCGSIEPGGRRIATCLKERVADLSDVCKARMAELAVARTTCRADVEKQCSTKTRRTQKVACVKDAVTKLGDECKAAIAAVVTREK
jgi:hypothetical protein